MQGGGLLRTVHTMKHIKEKYVLQKFIFIFNVFFSFCVSHFLKINEREINFKKVRKLERKEYI